MGIIKKGIKYSSIVPEYIAKATAIPTGILTAGAKGNALEKIAEGTKDLFTVPQEIYRNLTDFTQIANDYNTQTAREFASKYGSGAANTLMESLQETIEWGNQLAANMSDQPIETCATVGTITAGLYGVGRLIKFLRTKGQGGPLVKAERALGKKLFKDIE